MLATVPNNSEEFQQLQLLASLYSMNQSVILQKAQKYNINQVPNVHLILSTDQLQAMVSLDDLRLGNYKNSTQEVQIVENLIKPPPHTSSQQYVLFTVLNTEDTVYHFNYYDKTNKIFSIKLGELLPVYLFTLYSPDYNDPQYQQFSQHNVFFNARDKPILNIQNNVRQMQQLSNQIVNYDQLITNNNKLCEKIEWQLYENFKKCVKYIQDVNMYNINKLNTQKQMLVSQLNKFNKLVNVTVNCINQNCTQAGTANNTASDLNLSQEQQAINQVSNLNTMISNMVNVSQLHQAQQMMNLNTTLSQNLLNQFLNLNINNSATGSMNKNNSVLFNSPFKINYNQINATLENTKISVEQLQSVRYPFASKAQESQFMAWEQRDVLQKDFQFFLDQVINQIKNNEFINQLKKNQELLNCSLGLSKNQFIQTYHGPKTKELSISTEPEVISAQTMQQGEPYGIVSKHYDKLEINDNLTTLFNNNVDDTRPSQKKQPSQPKPDMPNQVLASYLEKIQIAPNSPMEKKARLIAKKFSLNNIDSERIFSELFGVNGTGSGLVSFWTVLFYHYGKHKQLPTVQQQEFRVVQSYMQLPTFFILNYCDGDQIQPFMIVNGTCCYYNLYAGTFDEYGNVSLTKDEITADQVVIRQDRLSVNRQDIAVQKQIIYEIY